MTAVMVAASRLGHTDLESGDAPTAAKDTTAMAGLCPEPERPAAGRLGPWKETR
jgi:hypothetical protein